ncbi:MAG: hypothetical protein FJW86_04335 [Actinobacteria bacterium]|nr:hypothetical protein [Actinomycetota bacterium]
MSEGAGQLANESVSFWLHAAGVLSEGIVVREENGRVVFINSAAERILGPAAEAIIHGRVGAGDVRFIHVRRLSRLITRLLTGLSWCPGWFGGGG